jgi:formylglycine-generating enzyme required for sulfatase activity
LKAFALNRYKKLTMKAMSVAFFLFAWVMCFGAQQEPAKCTDGRVNEALIAELVKNHVSPERIKIMIDQCVAGMPSVELPPEPVKCTNGRLSEAAIIELNKDHISPQRITSIIDQCRVRFQMTPEIRARLKNAGITDELIARAEKNEPPKPSAPASKGGGNGDQSSRKDTELEKLNLQAELVLWESIKETRSPEVFDDYLRRYPNGLFIAAARDRLREIKIQQIRLLVEQLLSDREWETAEARVAELGPFEPSTTDDIRKYKTQITAGRAWDHYRPQIKAAIQSGNWTDAENAVTELEQVVAENDEIRNYKRTIAAGKVEAKKVEDVIKPPADIPQQTLKFEFVKVPQGEFVMGCAAADKQCRFDEKPSHVTKIAKPFEIGKYEVTQAKWESVMGDNPSYFKGPDKPVENVSWTDVQEFLRRLNQKADGYRYRLPTEAEWEYAARAGASGIYPVAANRLAWSVDTGNSGTHDVGQKQPNVWGLYDMLGNVWEWVDDWYSRYSQTARRTTGEFKVLRGGAWNSEAPWIRVSARVRDYPGTRNGSIGFRCVREPLVP